ncbi:cytochrome P450 [Actinophytocola sp. NPDC049390]|uniref:cytochrome P450 n=1 Tax=Actinophytocola sp. NPDC049390 TaxID=3363894 RepID=UPI00378EEB2A
MSTLAEFDADPHPIYARLRDEEPVAWVPDTGQWFVTRWHDVLTVLSDPARFTGEHADIHDVFRRAYEPGLDADEIETITRPVARKAVDDVFTAGHADLTAEYFEPVAAVAEATLLGIGVSGADTLRRWGNTLARVVNDANRDPSADNAAIAAMTEDAEMAVVVDRLRNRADGSVVARLVRADTDVPALLKHVAISVVQPGWLAAWTLAGLWADPPQLFAVRRDRTLLGPAVYEALRWASPLGAVTRRTTRPVSLAGRKIPGSARLAVVLASANRDPAMFPDPDRFDVHRRIRTHLGFGAGPRHCPAHSLVTTVARIALDVLLDRMPDVRPAPGWRPAPHGWKLRLPGPLAAVWDAGRH